MGEARLGRAGVVTFFPGWTVGGGKVAGSRGVAAGVLVRGKPQGVNGELQQSYFFFSVSKPVGT